MTNKELIRYLRDLPDLLTDELTEQEFDLYVEVIGIAICRIKDSEEWRMFNCRRSDDRK